MRELMIPRENIIEKIPLPFCHQAKRRPGQKLDVVLGDKTLVAGNFNSLKGV
jgi:hypothetical protein